MWREFFRAVKINNYFLHNVECSSYVQVLYITAHMTQPCLKNHPTLKHTLSARVDLWLDTGNFPSCLRPLHPPHFQKVDWTLVPPCSSRSISKLSTPDSYHLLALACILVYSFIYPLIIICTVYPVLSLSLHAACFKPVFSYCLLITVQYV